MTSTTLPDLHAKLRTVLAACPVTLGDLRREHGFDDPVELLRATVGQFPDVYIDSTDAEGKPTLTLAPEAPPVDIMIDRLKLAPLLRDSTSNGIYLSTLHRSSGLSSPRILEVLAQAPNVERILSDKGKILFRLKEKPSTGPDEPSETDMEIARDQLVALCGDSTRDLHWLETQMPKAMILRVLDSFPDDFTVEDIDLGTATIKKVALKTPGLPANPALAPAPGRAASEQDSPPQLLSEVLSAEEIQALKFKPAAPNMGILRNDPRVMRGDRNRARTPLVQL